MAFNTNKGRQSFTATGGQTGFDFNFKIYNETDIKVYLTPVGQDPDDTADLLTYASDYTVSIDGDNGGTITLLSGAALNDIVVCERVLPRTRDISYVTNGDLKAVTLNEDQDYQTYLLVDDFNTADRSLSLPSTDVTMSPELPATLSNGYLKVKSDGTGYEYVINDGLVTSNPIWLVDTVDQLAALDFSFSDTAEVRDLNRGGTFIYNSAEVANDDQVTNFNGWVRQYDGAVSVKWAGAKGDGITDDSDAIKAAIAVGDIVITSGAYKCNSIVLTKDMDMEQGAILSYNGLEGGYLIDIAGNNLKLNTLRVSGGNIAVNPLVLISGASSEIGEISCKNVDSPLDSGTTTVVKITSSKNNINSILIRDCANTGNVNGSMPQGLVITNDSVNNVINSCDMKTCRSGVVIASAATEAKIDNLSLFDMSDNGIYQLYGTLSVGTYHIDGNEEALITKGDLTIDTMTIEGSSIQAIGLDGDAVGNVTIGQLILKNPTLGAIIRTRSGNTSNGDIKIGTIVGHFTTSTQGGLFRLSTGTIEFLTIGKMDIKCYVDNDGTFPFSDMSKFEAVKGFNLTNFNVMFIDKNAAAQTAGVIYNEFGNHANLTKRSYIDNLRFIFLDPDEVTVADAVRTQGIGYNPLVSWGNIGKLYGTLGPYMMDDSFLPSRSGQNISNNMPTVGKWYRGATFYNDDPSASGFIGWVCVVGDGTGVGTWKTFGTIGA